MALKRSLAQKLISWRIWVQMAFLTAWLDPLVLRYHRICAPVFHCHACPLATFACPIGLLHQFSALHICPFVTVGILVIFGAFLGGFICGWLCPMGLLQDLFSQIPVRKFKIPPWISYFRYLILIGLVLIIPYLYGVNHPLAICQVCPIGALESSLPRKIAVPFIAGEPINWSGSLILKLTLLGVFIAAMFFTHRPWCRICPLGAIFGLFNRFNAIFLKFKPDSCTSCKMCHTSCDLVVEPDKNSDSADCIRCLECTRCQTQALTLGTIFQTSDPSASRAEEFV